MPVPQAATTALPAPRPELVRPSEAAKPYTPAKTMEATTAARTSFVVLVVFRNLRMSKSPWSRSYRPDRVVRYSGDRRCAYEMRCARGMSFVSAGVTRKGDGWIERAHLVDERGEPVGNLRIFELEHVLGVQLTGMREVEAADEDRVVGNRHLRVHVVVHGARRVRRRDLAGEGRAGERRPQQRRLPLRIPVL